MTDGRIDEVRDRRSGEPVSISLVIVTYNNGSGLLECLQSIREQTFRNYEIIVVDNGETGKFAGKITGNHVYIRLKRNYGLNAGRNIGSRYGRSGILAFLDDDCLLDPEHLRNSVDFLDKGGCYGFRGRIRPRSGSIYNGCQSHYDLGDEPFPYLINTEGNCVIKKEMLLEAGGWEESLDFAGGFEGLLLSYNLVSRFGREGLMYFPGALILHDFSDSFLKIVKKDLRHEVFLRRLLHERPELGRFSDSYAGSVPERPARAADAPGWGARMSMSARDGILSRPTLKRFLFRYFYRSRPEAFRELGRELSGRILGKGKA